MVDIYEARDAYEPRTGRYLERERTSACDLGLGKHGYTVPWGVFIDKEGRAWLRHGYLLWPSPGGTAQMRIHRQWNGLHATFFDRDYFGGTDPDEHIRAGEPSEGDILITSLVKQGGSRSTYKEPEYNFESELQPIITYKVPALRLPALTKGQRRLVLMMGLLWTLQWVIMGAVVATLKDRWTLVLGVCALTWLVGVIYAGLWAFRYFRTEPK